MRTAKSHDYVTHPNMLFDHQSLREAGASEGATLTLNLEAAPVKLRTIRATCYFSPLYTKKNNDGKPVLETGFPAIVLGALNRCDSIVHCMFYRDPYLRKRQTSCDSIVLCAFYTDP